MKRIRTRPYRELRAKMSPASRAKAEKRANEMLSDMPLCEVRHAREMSQKHLAEILRINQASVSKLERRTDMYISTLRNVIEAMHSEGRTVFITGQDIADMERVCDCVGVLLRCPV